MKGIKNQKKIENHSKDYRKVYRNFKIYYKT